MREPSRHALRGRARQAAAACALCAGLVAFPLARADPTAVVNGLRTDGCARVPAARVAARRDSVLDAAAFEMGRDAKLADALARVGYPAAKSTSFHVRGSSDDDVIREMLAKRYCAQINDPLFVELGVHQRGVDTWIVMAARSAVPFTALRDPAAVAPRVVDLVTAARGQARRCGRERYEAAPPLRPSSTLTAVASLHALDMAERGSLGHEGSDGSTSGERMTRAGFGWQASGENVAAGQPDAESAVQAWLDSPGHCATLMQPRFTETGIAFALAPGKNPAIYWTQVFATPR